MSSLSSLSLLAKGALTKPKSKVEKVQVNFAASRRVRKKVISSSDEDEVNINASDNEKEIKKPAKRDFSISEVS
jgi:hypothetical protein